MADWVFIPWAGNGALDFAKMGIMGGAGNLVSLVEEEGSFCVSYWRYRG